MIDAVLLLVDIAAMLILFRWSFIADRRSSANASETRPPATRVSDRN